VLVVKIDGVDAEALKAGVASLTEVVGLAADTAAGSVGSRTVPNLVAMITWSR
jgi:hypothetical protein